MAEQPNKKRRNDVEIDKDNWDKDSAREEEGEQQGEFERATPEEIAKRRKIVVARGPDGAALPKSSNPFANISVATRPAEDKPAASPEAAAATEKPAEPSTADAKAPVPESAPSGEQPPTSSPPAGDAAAKAEAPAATGFGSLSSKGGGFTFGGGGFGSGNGTFGSTSPGAFGGATFGGFAGGGFGGGAFGGGSIFGSKPAAEAGDGEGDDDNPSSGSLFGGASGTVQLFSAKAEGAGDAETGKSLVQLPNERPVTGEEDEVVLFASDASLFVFGADKAWKERGKGEVRVNRAANGQARILMRQKGNFRLMLNATLFPAMSVQVMEGGRGVTFNCVNAALADDGAAPRNAAADAAKPADASAPTAEPTEPGAAATKKEDATRSGVDANGAAQPEKAPKEGEKAGEEAGSGSDKGGAAAAASAPAMVLHALRLRPPEMQQQFVRALNENKAGSQPTAAENGAWVPPV